MAAWNKGGAYAYSQHFAGDGTFTNILGMFFTGHQAFLDRQEGIFKGSGVLLLLGGASALLGVGPRVGIILLIVFMLGTTFPINNFWAVSDPQMKQADMINFLKNMALVGALLMLLAIPQLWPFSLASR